ncbi:ATP phosphoribosyltransferase regulatory subunit [Alkalilimnicola sp. S0819]|uniref:ATP phosphoribosyltransferase regulatory subunit n=1 Tax=Alkalilimnicola sp. S0819 TaxID=2613922 RepID=UPI0012617F28|nr:ATP phosphoribosyltransferase regulatory subunit [Alkalilimnicola sp. S0819]KAB7628358.1 ATP phosphoribosyltransferase regulatory subunit [Alkalilimnicola sp. S0819]MPQ15259.1 ATP phosphoribosyltransferase regulatory subunit [Alkalilimnicola sp. S0819]
MREPTFGKDNRWLLPEGVDEALPERAAALEALRRRLLDLYWSWGYEQIMPPFIEYLDSLLTGAGHDLDLQTFKLTDQLSGRLMGVRADMTPQAARIDAHQLNREGPSRLCYIGTVLQTRLEGLSRSRNPLQVGAELYGHAGVESEVEIISLMLATLASAGVGDVHLDLGHVGIFRGLVAQANLDEAAEAGLFDALQRKAEPDMRELLRGVEPAVAEMLLALVELNGGVEVLDRANEVLAGGNETVRTALKALWRIASALERHQPALPVHFDLAELRGYRYHTGAVFAAFVPEHGEEIARGGRYDQIGAVFGRSRPAVGFSADVRTLADLAGGEAATPRRGVLVDWSDDPAVLGEVRRLREQGERVVWAMPGEPAPAEELGCDRRLRREGAEWRLETL